MRRNCFLPFDPLLRLYTAEFGMRRIYPGDLGRVTKVGLLDRGAPPSLQPRLLSIRLPEKEACQCSNSTGQIGASS